MKNKPRNWAVDRKRSRNKATFRKDVVRNLKTHALKVQSSRGNAAAYFEFKENRVLDSHISELPPGGHSKMHRHMNEAIIYILKGRGYTLLRKANHATKRIVWRDGDLFSPPKFAWHQHFNDDKRRPARYLAITDSILMTRLKAHIIEQYDE